MRKKVMFSVFFVVSNVLAYSQLKTYSLSNFSDQRALALKMRVGLQKTFNDAVHIGDKVYVIPTDFGGSRFKIFVICNPITKKVVMDYFFKGITIGTGK